MSKKKICFSFLILAALMLVRFLTLTATPMPFIEPEQGMQAYQSAFFVALFVPGGWGETAAYFGEAFVRLLVIFVFNYLFSDYLYQDFCISGVYAFSRQAKRSSWYARRCAQLALFSFAAALLYLGGGLLLSCLLYGAGDLSITFAVFLPTALCWALFLFFTTLAVNLLAIRRGSMFAFLIVFGAVVLCAFLFLLRYSPLSAHSGSIGDPPTILLRGLELLFVYFNPVVHLGVGWHSDPAHQDFMNQLAGVPANIVNLPSWAFSLLYLLLLSALAAAVGWLLIRRQDISLDNKELI